MQDNSKNTKRRGRPKKQKIEIPHFDTNAEFRQYLLDCGKYVLIDMLDQALKRGNVRKPEIARVKYNQHKVVLDAIKTLDGVLKNTQIDEIETQVKSISMGLTPGNDAPKLNLEKIQSSLQVLKEAEQ